MYSLRMLIRLHRLRERGWPIPRYQFAFKKTILGELTVHEVRDPVLNRHTRVATSSDRALPTNLRCSITQSGGWRVQHYTGANYSQKPT